jgi:hypothetical protein
MLSNIQDKTWYTLKDKKNVSEISLESRKVAGLLLEHFWIVEKQCF